MMKLIIFGAAAFLLGIGGSTGVLVMRAPALPPGADSLAVAHAAAGKDAHGAPGAKPAPDAKAAAAHAAAAARDSAAAGHAGTADARGAAPADPAPDAHIVASQPAEAVVRPVATTGVHEGRSARLPDAESYKSVGNILMNMKPTEAAKILAYLSDAQVEGLLRSMSPRNAASVLSQLPSERAAALSRRLLVPAPKEERP